MNSGVGSQERLIGLGSAAADDRCQCAWLCGNVADGNELFCDNEAAGHLVGVSPLRRRIFQSRPDTLTYNATSKPFASRLLEWAALAGRSFEDAHQRHHRRARLCRDRRWSKVSPLWLASGGEEL